MRAEEFWYKFKEKLNESNVREYALEKWNDRGNFTEFIIPTIADLLKDDYAISREYYNIDLIGWLDKKEQLPSQKGMRRKLAKHLWQLEIAIEHENDRSDWTDELIKLLYINCPLRVVIGYISADVAADSLQMSRVIEYASESIRLVNENRALIRENQDFLLIFGKCENYTTDISADTYLAFKYDCYTNSFIRLDT